MPNERDMDTFWGRLNFLLDELGWEEEGRAARLSYEVAIMPGHPHVKESTIASWGKKSTRRGGRQPDYENVYPVAKLLGVTVGDLLTGLETNQRERAERRRQLTSGEDGGEVADKDG